MMCDQINILSCCKRSSTLQDDGEAAEEGGEGSVMREDVLSTRSCRSSVKVLDQTLIHPNEVLKALRAFVEDHREPPK